MNARLQLLPRLSGSLPTHRAFARQIIRQWKTDGVLDFNSGVKDFSCSTKCLPLNLMMRNFTRPQIAAVADELLLLLLQQQPPLDPVLYSLMLCFADNELFPQFRVIWDQLLNSSSLPSLQTLTALFHILAKSGHFAKISDLLAQLRSRYRSSAPLEVRDAFSAAVSCFGEAGQLELMEATISRMVSDGFTVGAAAANAYVRCYSIRGSLAEMEDAFGRLKRSRYLIDEEGIRAVSLAYLRKKKLYRLGEFVREVGLGRKDVGTLLWNLLLLSYAARFKMKSLQREFLRMIECGFGPDITTFNLRAIAFSRMSLWWDLHLSLQHMRHESVVPDIVTYGCVVDAYLDRRLGRNLEFALNAMVGLDDSSPMVLTDPLVFEILGKGDFHASSDAFLEFTAVPREWTYRKLINVYKKKYYRRNQIFWNY